MTVNEVLAFMCGASLLAYGLINPNMDAERDMYDDGEMTRYYVVKYFKWLLVIVGTYSAYRVVFARVFSGVRRQTR
jgi:hypothetical protein